MAIHYKFNEDDMVVDEGLGYPTAYAKICRDRGVGLYSRGPPICFSPYSLHQEEILKAKELDKIFPVIDPKAKPTTKPKIFLGLLWKQLDHLGNAGFDPAMIRVDPYGNVLYYHADSASPLAWEIDHWFPCSRGGLTVPSNLRILQWQVYKKKYDKPEFLVPWWDFQLGISVNQFLSMFASCNSDFRHRGFSFLFLEGENEEINKSQTVESHCFPQHFIESQEKLGLAPAAIVSSRRESHDSSLPLKSLDYNRQIRSKSPAVGKKVNPGVLKENKNPDFATNPYQAIVMARDSLRQREEAQNMQIEIQKMDEEVDEMKRKNDEEKLLIQDLELELIKRRRRAEKCRRLAESQSSYRTMLEKMIRDAMHQSVIYKEQVRLNQVAANALMARLEAQKAICDASEKELHKRYKQREEVEKQIRPAEWEKARKRSRTDDDAIFDEERHCINPLYEERDRRTVLYLPGIRPKTPVHKELRVFLEEEHKASEGEEYDKSIVAFGVDENSIDEELKRLEIGEEKKNNEFRFSAVREPKMEEEEEDEESRKERGKGNVEKWLQMLLENSQQELLEPRDEKKNETNKKDDIIKKLDQKYPLKDKEGGVGKKKEEIIQTEESKAIGRRNSVEGVGSSHRKSFEGVKERMEKNGTKERKLERSESGRAFRRIPSSPSLILKKGVDCIRKKPMVVSDDDDDDDNYNAGNGFIRSSINTIKKAVRI